ncbi:hypothetical protein V2A60_006583 [Cordyceps javanica]|uniref:Uncharacterized protein n=1 Tax=Cordyceps javanica TaxID=43265 RepID=A0A545V7I9_9HYPO|nr:hypothetical protein IF1G_03423 [Cordyceps javanica]TQW09139.1 incA protein domain-containing protein [Cordyceps javanica]
MARRSHSQSLSFEIDSSLPRRNRSRASNISRKRRFGQTNHQTSEPDRKRLAMTEAVKHWNECIQITTEESNQARSTIHSLKKKLQRQANELQVAQSAVKTGKTDLQTLQEQLQDLTRQNTRYSQDKKSLENRIHELNVGYEKLRNQVKEMPAKFNGLEEKLVNTITEQRELFNKSKNLYTNLENQIKQGDVREKATAEAVEKALQSNKEKREEFKKVVEHMQHDFQYKTAEFERKIKTLEKENETQCDQIDALEEDKERFYNEIIASRTTRACIEKVDSQLSGLITQLRVLDASQDTVAIELRDMKTRVEDLRHDQDFAELKEQVSRSHAKLNSLENLIQGSLLPAIEGIATKQSESNASVTSLAAAAEGGWSKLQEQIQTHAIDLRKTMSDAQRFYEMLAGHVDAKFLSQEIVSRELITGLKKNFEAAFETLKENLGLQLSQWTNSRKSAPSDRKWLQDVEAVRLKLRQVESQLSKVDDVPLSLKKIYDMSVLIRETSRFMDKEEHKPYIEQPVACMFKA